MNPKTAPMEKPARAKPGPVSQLEQRLERLKQLPRAEQDFILKFLDTVLERNEQM